MKSVYILLISLMVFAGCRSKAGLNQQKGPFKGSSYKSNKVFFRASANAESMNLDSARILALSLANEQLVLLVRTEINDIYKKYITGSIGVNNTYGQRFKNVTLQGMNQTLFTGLKQIAERVYETQRKTYQVWVVQELRKREFYRKLIQHILDNSEFNENEKKELKDLIDKTIADLNDKY
ncbi:MAG: hypothetical protein H7296_07975 [Bacteroidia bacterium]|nr:hypothetical protein [Bacteroidia bacterium]